MPEGDTIRAVADALRPLLVGHPLRAVRVGPDAGSAPETGTGDPLEGRTVDRVEAIGKHLLVGVGDVTLRVHLGMDGSWHRYRPGERWQRARSRAGLLLATDDVVLVCFEPREVERAPTRALADLPALRQLGPDLSGAAWDPAEVLRRARAPHRADRPIAVLLLDQGVAAGIGNVYKSETLFLERVAPTRAVAANDDETLLRLFTTASTLLRANRAPGHRTTTRDPRRGDPFAARAPRLWVYRRTGRPCLRCGAAIRSTRQGTPTPRATYWCPGCQPD